MLVVKVNTTQIAKLLQRKQRILTSIEEKKLDQRILSIEGKIQWLNKIMLLKHIPYICSITKLSNLEIVIRYGKGYITLFTVDDENEQWTKIKENEGYIIKIFLLLIKWK